MSEPMKLGDVLKNLTRTSSGPAAFHCADCGAELPEVPNHLRDPGRYRLICKACDAKARKEQEEREKAERTKRDEAEGRRIEAEREAALKMIRRHAPAALHSCGVPERWRGAGFDCCGDLPRELVEKARTWVEKPGGILYLSGVTGCGKTFLAASILRHGLETGVLISESALKEYYGEARPYNYLDELCERCFFTSERDYLASLKAEFDRESSWSSPGHRARYARLVVLDDLAASRLTDWGRGEVAGLIEGRHADELPTVITTNLTLDELTGAVDARVSSRIAESRQVWTFPARDFRLSGTVPAHSDGGQPGS